MAKENPEAAWFGFEPIAPSEKTARVTEVFSHVADKYDLMNDVMSMGLHRLWKNHFVRSVNLRPHEKMLDVAGGTGDIALRCARRTNQQASITVCDINPAMIAVGKDKALDAGIFQNLTWVEGNAEDLPFPDQSFDVVTIAFGLRNVAKIDAALRSFWRVLRPGGRFFCMEFCPNVTPLLRPIMEAYCLNVLPVMGEMIADDAGAYRYLAESIQKFPDQKSLATRLEKAGFEKISWENLTAGTAVIHKAWRI